MVVELPRAPGARENRWAHLLSGPPDMRAVEAVAAPAASGAIAVGEIAALRHNVDALARELADVKAELARVMEELGIKR